MPNPIRFDTKIILAKIETTYGTDPTPTGAANAMLMKGVEIRPMEGQDVSRNIERPYMGAQEEFPAGLYSVLTGSVELVGSGSTGVAPAWGPLLRACGCAEVVTADVVAGDGTVKYNPITDNIESVCLHFYVGTTRHILKGCRGSAEFGFNAQGIPEIKFTLTGLFSIPTDQARPTPDLTHFMVPSVVSQANTPTFTVDTQSLVTNSVTFNLGCSVSPRLYIGREAVIITDRAESLTAKVEAVPLTTWDPFTKANNRTRVAVVLQHGTTVGRRVKLEAGSCAIKRLSGYENSQNILEWPLQLTPQPTAGNDQWLLTLT